MLFQLKKVLGQKIPINQVLRCFYCNKLSAKVLLPLQNKRLLKITGPEVSVFLQGLITNDMGHFESVKSMYAMFLNNKGRVLYDTLVHKWDGEDSYLLETDKKTVDQLQKHLKIYKLKRQVKIEDVNEDLKLWVLLSPSLSTADLEISLDKKFNIYKDPRLVELGYRVVASSSLAGKDIATAIGKDIELNDSEEVYRHLRYKLGVSEGADDLPPGMSFPLEANCDYLHGVSFHKGCYIGQELTARVHHTGVVRKRIMPLRFTKKGAQSLEQDLVITAGEKKANVGKLRGISGEYGLGLLRIKEALDAKVLTVGDYEAEVVKPSWWPREAPKEKIGSSKVDVAQE
ncbi:putative transferase CAF17 homolog, mitochondrial [Plutella xylostella]|uniref:putative transferase CAF17 homolog, mitochondrial n=1 Tax=Plutella xylostella TaxID=51655 RepID=UPI002032DBC9|nr:putative transferase CAF17 homolog, mitochondrial [Plutella xylostella]